MDDSLHVQVLTEGLPAMRHLVKGKCDTVVLV